MYRYTEAASSTFVAMVNPGVCKQFMSTTIESKPSYVLMSRKRIFLFFLSILLLIASEYLLLNELMAEADLLPMLLSGSILLASVFFVVRFYKEWRESLK